MMKIILLMGVLLSYPNMLAFFWLNMGIIIISLSYSSNGMMYVGSMSMNFDFLSSSLISMTFWLTLLLMVAQQNIQYKNLLSLFFLLLNLMLVLTFISSNLFLFYFFFECSLLPIFLVILGWGYQPERMKASMSLFFYTLFASLPLLVSIFILVNFSFMPDMFMFVYCLASKLYMNNIFSFFIIFAFLVKFPMYSVHLWLPKAHVEAPVSGSMILAGTLLKLGGYGMIRMSFYTQPSIMMEMIFSLALLGGVVLSISCLTFSDMKVVIAYSSVVHMALVIIGVFSMSKVGIEGAMIIMLAHGFCSSGMFCGANMMYEKSHSRSYFFNGGNLSIFPSFSLFWFILVMANFGGPFTFNLLGEILLILNLYYISLLSVISMLFLSFFSAAYSLILYSSTQQGQVISLGNSFSLVIMREKMLLFSHIWPLFLFPISCSMV